MTAIRGDWYDDFGYLPLKMSAIPLKNSACCSSISILQLLEVNYILLLVPLSSVKTGLKAPEKGKGQLYPNPKFVCFHKGMVCGGFLLLLRILMYCKNLGAHNVLNLLS